MPTQPDVAPQLLSAKEVSARLKVSSSHASNLLASGAMPTIRIGGSVRVTEQALADFITANTHATPRARLRKIGRIA